jgi:hypothetical protein
LKSSGPTTARGKAVVAGNALKHGLLSSRIVVAWAGFELEQDFDILRADLAEDLRPDGAVEDLLVEKIAVGFWRLQRMWAFESAQITENGRSQTLKELRTRRASAEADGATASGQAEQWARYYTAATAALRRAIAKLPGGAKTPRGPERCIRGALKELASAPLVPLETEAIMSASTSTLVARGTRSYGWFRGTLSTLDSERGKLPEHETMTVLSGIAARMRERLADDELLRQAWVSSHDSVGERTPVSQDPSDQARALFSRYLVPPAPELDVYVRYETSVERRLERDIGNLLVLKSIRSGTSLPPRLRLALRQ